MRLLTGILDGSTFTPICNPTARRGDHRKAFKEAKGVGEVIIFQQVKKRALTGLAQTPPAKVVEPVAEKTVASASKYQRR